MRDAFQARRNGQWDETLWRCSPVSLSALTGIIPHNYRRRHHPNMTVDGETVFLVQCIRHVPLRVLHSRRDGGQRRGTVLNLKDASTAVRRAA